MEKGTIDFKIKGMELSEVSLNSFQIPLDKNLSFQYEITLEQIFQAETNTIFISCVVNIASKDNKIHLGSLKCYCAYGIENLNQFLSPSNTYELPEQLTIALNSITLSTTRGVMFSTFKGTILHNAILPIMDPKTFTIT